MKKHSFSDEQLRSAFGNWVASGESQEGPDPARIWDAVSGASNAVERRRVIAEIARRPSSLRWWQLAEEVMSGEDRRPHAVHREESLSTWWRGWLSSIRVRMLVWGAAAAVGAAVVLFTVVNMNVGKEPPGIYRRPDESIFRPGVEDGASLPRDAAVLRWTCGIETHRYDVVVQTRGLNTVFVARDLPQPEFRIPEHALLKVPEGTSLLWRVTAHRSDGTEVKSATFEFVLE